MKVRSLKNGEPYLVSPDGYHYTVCCDCGLTHLERIQKADKGFTVMVYRDDHETFNQHVLRKKASQRRRKGKRKKK